MPLFNELSLQQALILMSPIIFAVFLLALLIGRGIARLRSPQASDVNTRVTLVQEESRQVAAVLRKDIDRLQVQMDGLPDHDDLNQVHERITSVDSRLQQIVGGINGLMRTVDLMNSHLLKERS